MKYMNISNKKYKPYVPSDGTDSSSSADRLRFECQDPLTLKALAKGLLSIFSWVKRGF
jgi:hypothetical protein